MAATVDQGNLGLLNFNEEETLSLVELPVLVIVGRHDRVTLPKVFK